MQRGAFPGTGSCVTSLRCDLGDSGRGEGSSARKEKTQTLALALRLTDCLALKYGLLYFPEPWFSAFQL